MTTKLTLTTKPLEKLATDVLITFLPEDRIVPAEKKVDALLGGTLAKLRKGRDFTGEEKKTRLVFAGGRIPRVLLVGLGNAKGLSLEKFRGAASTAAGELARLPVTKATVLLPAPPRFTAQELAQALTESLLLASYKFVPYKTDEKSRETKLEEIEFFLPIPRLLPQAKRAIDRGQIIAQAVSWARDLGNHPGNVATPAHLANHALALARANKKLKVKILDRKAIQKEKMGALLAVAQGSDEEPKFIILEYPGKRGGAPVVLVGKGITFDSGGLSIKPSEKMEEMKFDMAGAATVLGTIKAAAELKLPLNLVGLIPATENLPSGKAIKPGDIVKSRSGKTIEVVNTDAEGRMVLSDALDYAKQYKPALVMDFATLTGAIVVALGDDLVGAFSNKKDLIPKLETAATITGEKIWPMPLEPAYEELIKSDFADLRNISTVRFADAVHAANFLKNFVDYPWIHLDIAGVAWATREKPYRPKGATGIGIRLALEFLKNLK